MFRKLLPIVFLIIFSSGLLYCYHRQLHPDYLIFSDAAKFGDIARNLLTIQDYGASFAFYSNLNLPLSSTGLFSAARVPQLVPLIIAITFRIFGINDFSVLLSSSVFFILTIVLTYLLAKLYFGSFTAVLSSLTVAANSDLLQYATTGAAEPLFISELLSAVLLFSYKKPLLHIAGILVLLAMYFTRPQAPLYIVPLLIFVYLHYYSHILKPRLQVLFIILFVLLLVPVIIAKLPSFLIASLHYSVLLPANTSLRLLNPPLLSPDTLSVVIKKVLYNLYNFYKLLPQIYSPYLFILFLISFFVNSKNLKDTHLRYLVLSFVAFAFISTAILVPFFRYLHPTIPFVYIIAVSLLTRLVSRKLASIFLVLFIIMPTLGIIALDSRAISRTTNRHQPPAYVLLSTYLKDHTSPSDIIVTNLDTWGSWYGQRKTVWFPLSPSDLNQSPIQPDAIFLTNYLIDDENYYAASSWRQALESPQSITDSYLATHYHMKDKIDLLPTQVYENSSVSGVLFTKIINEK